MIRIRKGPKPTVLERHADQWTREYLAHRNAGTAPPESLVRHYRDPEVKQATKQETHEKCAYCESKVSHVYPGDVEHILPKRHRPDLIFDWENLTYACAECNVGKLDYYDEASPLVNPYADDPDDHLAFHGPLLLNRPGADKGILTVAKLELNRARLFEKRKEQLERINRLVDLWAKTDSPAVKEVIKGEILAAAGEDHEYAMMVRAFIASLRL